MVPALHAARSRAHRRAAGPLRRRRLQGAGAHRRPAGAGLEPARLSHAGGGARRRAQRQHGRPAGRAHRLRSGAQGRGDVPDHVPRPGMAGEALRHAGCGEGHSPRRRRDALRRCWREGHHGVEPRRPASRHHRHHCRSHRRDRLRRRPQRRGLCRRRHPARHRHPQGAGARRARRAGRPAAAVGSRGGRRRRRAGGDGASAATSWSAPCSSPARRRWRTRRRIW